MEKKRSVWITVFGIGFLYFTLPTLCSSLFYLARGDIALSRPGYFAIIIEFVKIICIISAIGLFFLKKWARISIIFCSAFFLIYNLYFLFLRPSLIYGNVISVIISVFFDVIEPLFFAVALYYFLRPNVKEQFEAGREIWKSRSHGIYILAFFMVLIGLDYAIKFLTVIIFAPYLLSISKVIDLVISSLFFPAGIALFKLKEWGRILSIRALVLSFGYAIIEETKDFFIERRSLYNAFRPEHLTLLLILWLIYFLTRPKIKEQFK